MAPKFLVCGCKIFTDGGIIMCPEHAYEYNLKRTPIAKVFGSDLKEEKKDDGKSTPV